MKGRAISIKDLENTPAGMLPQNRHLFGKKAPKKKRQPSKIVLWMHDTIEQWCKEKGLHFHSELQFHEFRKFRFDFAITDHKDHRQAKLKLGIEYQGLNSPKSGHTTILGFTKDQDKANLAQSEGWKLLTFTVINYREIIEQIEKCV